MFPRPPLIALTMGDPAGVGPELALRALADSQLLLETTPVLYGDLAILQRVSDATGLPLPSTSISLDDWPAAAPLLRGPAVLDFHSPDAPSITPGHVDSSTGAASYAYIDRAIRDALHGVVDAITTGPIHKEAFAAACVPFPGHTELLAARTSSPRSCMMLTSPEITCSLVTAHVGLRDVAPLLSTPLILDAIQLTADAMARLRSRPPRLTVCGLNPHAGEHGLFGLGEEESIIAPAIQAALDLGLNIRGPLPPDTAFLPRLRAETDAYICMYHDQGLIPLKMLAFDTAVNVTLGLPIIRTSVDHGTALDLAWQGLADPSSLFAALRLASRLSRPTT